MVKDTQGGFLISQIKQLGDRMFEKLLVEAGISEFNGPQGRILYVLWQEEKLPIVELSRRTSLAKTTLTGMLDRMEARGLVSRRFDPEDRRQIRIVLTEETRALREKYELVSRQANDIFYRGFTQEEVVRLERALRRVLENLRERGE